MDRDDRQAIEGPFARLADVERQSPQRDVEAEAYIHDQIARQPGAPYFMAQTTVVQEQALNAAQALIDELEREVASRPPSGGGLLSGIFSDSRQSPRPTSSVPHVGRPVEEATERAFSQVQPQRAGGGSLAGAAQTAMGVAGGVLLGNMIAGMFGGDEVQAAQSQAGSERTEDPDVEDSGFDDMEI
ncbi:DUF2076 domain-containing protein [Sinorhizobium medicae]|uniref:DUF2076 domain-containing protein n=1 Tax=Sinorhizobium medicae TaxID=110321 RepID=A0ABX4TGV2_9HYPH|nr:DUF2076 domain-containing protein [Sinorhizobium medicae]PLT99481.1 hypothetical protein BMJ33_23060 [Sinorhizobium medicae]PLU74770.1 hypothetical protein BMJ19_36265 [Sinorhizobium medicae]